MFLPDSIICVASCVLRWVRWKLSQNKNWGLGNFLIKHWDSLQAYWRISCNRLLPPISQTESQVLNAGCHFEHTNVLPLVSLRYLHRKFLFKYFLTEIQNNSTPNERSCFRRIKMNYFIYQNFSDESQKNNF